MPPQEGALLGVSGRLKSIVKHKIMGVGKRVSRVKTGVPILTICTSCDLFLRKELPFEGNDNCTCIKICNGIIF